MQNDALVDAPQNIAVVVGDWIDDQEVVWGAFARTIFSGLTGVEDSKKTWKDHIREVRATPGALPTNLVGKPSKEARMEYNTITFTLKEVRECTNRKIML